MNYSHLSLDSLHFYFLELGQQHSHTLFFTCGANQEPDGYLKFFELMSTKYRVVVLCYPGIGNSFKWEQLSTPKYLDYIELFISHKFGSSPFTACGISLGGLLLAKYIHLKRTGNITNFVGLSIMTRVWSTSFLSNALRFLVNETYKYRGLRFHSFAWSIFSWKNLRSLWEKKKLSDYAINLVLDKGDLDWFPTMPSLIIVGEKDNVIDIEYTRELFEHKPNVKFISVLHQRHDAFLNIGDTVLSMFEDFLDSRE